MVLILGKKSHTLLQKKKIAIVSNLVVISFLKFERKSESQHGDGFVGFNIKKTKFIQNGRFWSPWLAQSV